MDASANSSRCAVRRPCRWPVCWRLPRNPTTGKACAKASGDEALAACTAPSSPAPKRRALALAYSNRGVEWKAQGRSRQRHRRLRRGHQGRSRSSPPPTTTAASPRRKRDYDKAIADYDEAIELNPKYASALTTAASPISTRASTSAPSPTTTRRSSSSPMRVRLNNRGNAYASRGEFDRAIQDFDEAVNARSRSYAIAFYNRGNAHFAKGDPDRAIAQLRSGAGAQSEIPGRPGQPRRRPREEGRSSTSAIADYDEALKLEPKDAVAYNNRGNALLKKGDYDRPSPTTISAIQLDGNMSPPISAAPSPTRARSASTQAIADYGQVTKLQPQNAAAWNSRCWTRAIDRPAAGGAGGLQRGAEAEARLHQRARQPRLRAAAHGPLSTRRSPTMTRRCRSSRTRWRRCTGAAWPSAARATTPAATSTSRRRRRSSRTSSPEFARYGLLPPLTDAVAEPGRPRPRRSVRHAAAPTRTDAQRQQLA